MKLTYKRAVAALVAVTILLIAAAVAVHQDAKATHQDAKTVANGVILQQMQLKAMHDYMNDMRHWIGPHVTMFPKVPIRPEMQERAAMEHAAQMMQVELSSEQVANKAMW